MESVDKVCLISGNEKLPDVPGVNSFPWKGLKGNVRNTY